MIFNTTSSIPRRRKRMNIAVVFFSSAHMPYQKSEKCTNLSIKYGYGQQDNTYYVLYVYVLCCVPTPNSPTPNGISLVESEGSLGNNKYQK